MPALPATHAQALSQGSRFYRGLPCATHPDAPRYTHNRACVECEAARGKAHKAARREHERERKRAWKAANPDRVKAEKARYAARHAQALACKRVARFAAKRERDAIPRAMALVAKTARALARALRQHLAQLQARAARDARMHELQAMRYAASMVNGQRGDALTLRELRERVKRGKHRAKARGRVISLRAHELAAIGNAQGWACAHCGHVGELVLDHIRPISKGGHHVAGNVQWLCRFHNEDKGNTMEGDYRRLRGIPCATPWDVL